MHILRHIEPRRIDWEADGEVVRELRPSHLTLTLQVHFFLYGMTYYVLVPGIHQYAHSIGVHTSLSGIETA